MNLDKFIKNFLQFLKIFLWFCFVVLLLLWFDQNRDKFFPVREIQRIVNPVNPFE